MLFLNDDTLTSHMAWHQLSRPSTSCQLQVEQIRTRHQVSHQATWRSLALGLQLPVEIRAEVGSWFTASFASVHTPCLAVSTSHAWQHRNSWISMSVLGLVGLVGKLVENVWKWLKHVHNSWAFVAPIATAGTKGLASTWRVSRMLALADKPHNVYDRPSWVDAIANP